jgi:hypothetical protein
MIPKRFVYIFISLFFILLCILGLMSEHFVIEHQYELPNIIHTQYQHLEQQQQQQQQQQQPSPIQTIKCEPCNCTSLTISNNNILPPQSESNDTPEFQSISSNIELESSTATQQICSSSTNEMSTPIESVLIPTQPVSTSTFNFVSGAGFCSIDQQFPITDPTVKYDIYKFYSGQENQIYHSWLEGKKNDIILSTVPVIISDDGGGHYSAHYPILDGGSYMLHILKAFDSYEICYPLFGVPKYLGNYVFETPKLIEIPSIDTSNIIDTPICKTPNGNLAGRWLTMNSQNQWIPYTCQYQRYSLSDTVHCFQRLNISNIWFIGASTTSQFALSLCLQLGIPNPVRNTELEKAARIKNNDIDHVAYISPSGITVNLIPANSESFLAKLRILIESTKQNDLLIINDGMHAM